MTKSFRKRKFNRQMLEAVERLNEQRRRSRLRAQIAASEMPEVAKDMLSMFVDPVGYANELVDRQVRQARKKSER